MGGITEDDQKPIHTIILDSGPIIRNHPTVSSLLAQSSELLTIPAILATELRDAATRSRVETTLVPFLTVRQPREESVKFVTDFARRTGDGAVLSRVDLAVAALAYEVECERNGGDWRLRRVPGQKRVNGAKPDGLGEGAGVSAVVDDAEAVAAGAKDDVAEADSNKMASTTTLVRNAGAGLQQATAHDATGVAAGVEGVIDRIAAAENVSGEPSRSDEQADLVKALNDATLDSPTKQVTDRTSEQLSVSNPGVVDQEGTLEDVTSSDEDGTPSDEAESDGGEWITPSNLSRRRAADTASASTSNPSSTPKMQVATITTDHALQNLLLQINLNLLSADSLTRISTLRTTLLRCHACFLLHKTPDLSFCSRCGKPTLTRVTVTTDASTGQVKVHLKKNMRWNTRGDRYSIPKPVHGSANGKVVGGGKGGWGTGLVLAEDQKEWVREVEEKKREENRKARGGGGMDEDYLPGILTGRREGGRAGGRLKVGAGRNVNSKRR